MHDEDRQGEDGRDEDRKGQGEEQRARDGDTKNEFSGHANGDVYQWRDIDINGDINLYLRIKRRKKVRRFAVGLTTCLVADFMLGDVYAQIFKGHHHLDGSEWVRLVLASCLVLCVVATIYAIGKRGDPLRTLSVFPGFSALLLIPIGYHVGPTDLTFLDSISHFLGNFLLWER